MRQVAAERGAKNPDRLGEMRQRSVGTAEEQECRDVRRW